VVDGANPMSFVGDEIHNAEDAGDEENGRAVREPDRCEEYEQAGADVHKFSAEFIREMKEFPNALAEHKKDDDTECNNEEVPEFFRGELEIRHKSKRIVSEFMFYSVEFYRTACGVGNGGNISPEKVFRLIKYCPGLKNHIIGRSK
jgi:hypothetical protein